MQELSQRQQSEMAATLDILREYVAAATSPAVQPAVARHCTQLLPRLHAALPGALHVGAWDSETIRLLLSLLRFHTVMLQQCKVSFPKVYVRIQRHPRMRHKGKCHPDIMFNMLKDSLSPIDLRDTDSRPYCEQHCC